MAVRRKILTLTLIGLMAAFMGPICANAQTTYEIPPTDLTLVQTDEYDAMPTFGWTCISGPTSFVITAGTQVVSPAEGGVSAGTLKYDETAKVNKWDTRTGTAVTGKDGYYSYTYKPTTALSVGTVSSWKVMAVRAAKTKNDADLGFDGTKSTATSTTGFSVFGNVALSMTAAPAQVVAGKDTVTVKVALDNSAATSGGFTVATLDFDVTYDTALLDAPTVKGVGRVTTTPTATPGTGKVTVKIVANIVADTTDIVELAFKAKEGVTGGDVAFAFANVTATSADVKKAAKVKTTETSNAATKVMPAATEGVIVSGGTAPMLMDAVVALKISTALPLTDPQTAAVTKYAAGMGRPVGVRDAVYVLDALAK